MNAIFKLLFIALLAVVYTPDAAFANAACSTIDHSPRLPPVRNQRGAGWCYAFAAADLLTFEVGQPISGLGMAIMWSRGGSKDQHVKSMGLGGPVAFVAGTAYDLMVPTLTPEEFERGGNAPGVLKSGIENGPLCLEEQLPQIIPIPQMTGKLDGQYSTAQYLKLLRDHMRINVDERNILPVGTPYCTQAEGVQIIVPQMQLDDFRRITREILPGEDFLGKFYEGACTRKVYPNRSMRVRSVDSEADGQNMVDALNKQLERSPAAISYNSSSLSDASLDVSSLQDNHVSVITGRRFNASTGTCEYQLRNSWGESCENYAPEFRCERGLSWLSEAQVRRMAKNISGYEK